MRCILHKTKYINESFINWLISQKIKESLILHINPKKLKLLEIAFNNQYNLETKINFNKALIIAFNSLTYLETIGDFYIFFDQKIRYPKSDITIISILKFIDCGNMTTSGIRVFSNLFSEISNNPNKFYNMYMRQYGGWF